MKHILNFNADAFKELEVVTLNGKKYLKIDAMINIFEIPFVITTNK